MTTTITRLYHAQLLKTVKTDDGVYLAGSWQYVYQCNSGFLVLKGKRTSNLFAMSARLGVDFAWAYGEDPRTDEEKTVAIDLGYVPKGARSFSALLRRVVDAGISEEIFRTQVLPDWWCPEAEVNLGILPEIEIIVARLFEAWPGSLPYTYPTLKTIRDYCQALPKLADPQAAIDRYKARFKAKESEPSV